MSIETILGIDYGLKRVGIAVGNTLTHSAEPLTVIQRNDDAQVIRAIALLARQIGQPNDGGIHHGYTFIHFRSSGTKTAWFNSVSYFFRQLCNSRILPSGSLAYTNTASCPLG